MAGISHELSKLADELSKIESQTNAAHVRLGGAKTKLNSAQLHLDTMQAAFQSAEKQLADVNDRKAALLKQVTDLVKAEIPPVRDDSISAMRIVNAAEFPVLTLTVSDLELNVRPENCLKGASIYYLGDLVQLTEAEVLEIPNFGPKCLQETLEALSFRGLTLGMKVTGWSPPQP
ncbi:MAG: DNA-directed RNA polymerase subunit alpha [Parcubacteria group bacterium LiPW_30]|nr:MAG: DNA-directed RNA polymerase subunit alpha [Parcubacteria group bacterium LiPW_30]